MLDFAMTVTAGYNRHGELTLSYGLGDSTDPIDVNTGIRDFQLSPIWTRLRADIHKFKKILWAALKPGSPEIQNWGAVDNAIRQLYEGGLTLKTRIFNGRVPELRELFEIAFPCWDDPQCEPKCISLRARHIEDLIPIEFLPAFWETPSPPSRPISNMYALERACRGFLGFSTVVKRELLVSRSLNDLRLQNPVRLPIKFFGNSRLQGAMREYSFFQKNDAHIELDGPWQYGALGETTDVFVRNTTAHLWGHTCYCSGVTRQPPDQIIHFSCHCATTAADSQDHVLELTCGGHQKHTIKIRDLENRMTEIEDTPGFSECGPPRPLVFFNACGTSADDPAWVTSFPRLFLNRFRNRGFIGTVTEVPDPVAEAFSRQFYATLLRKLPLGYAMLDAKRSMLLRHRNPMGILYTVYADPDLEVSRQVKVLH